MIRNDPYLKAQHRRMLLNFLLMPLMLLVLISDYLLYPSAHLFAGIALVSFAILTSLVFLSMIILVRRAKRTPDVQRERALQGDTALLAHEQPMPNAEALPLPTTIEVQYSLRATGLSLLFLIMFLIFAIPLITIILSGSSQRILLLLIIPCMALVWLIFVLLVSAYARSMQHAVIMLDEQGITSTYQRITSSINWSEARLFTQIGPRSVILSKTYELSSEAKVVRWTWFSQQRSSVFSGRKFATSYEDYNRQMSALFSLIAGKTHLPLYDLREPQTKPLVLPETRTRRSTQ